MLADVAFRIFTQKRFIFTESFFYLAHSMCNTTLKTVHKCILCIKFISVSSRFLLYISNLLFYVKKFLCIWNNRFTCFKIWFYCFKIITTVFNGFFALFHWNTVMFHKCFFICNVNHLFVQYVFQSEKSWFKLHVCHTCKFFFRFVWCIYIHIIKMVVIFFPVFFCSLNFLFIYCKSFTYILKNFFLIVNIPLWITKLSWKIICIKKYLSLLCIFFGKLLLMFFCKF